MSLPDARNTSTDLDGAVEFSNLTEADDCVHSSNQEELHVSWGDLDSDEPVDGMCESSE